MRCPELQRITGNCHATAFGSSWVKSYLALCFIVPPVARSGVYSTVVDPFLRHPSLSQSLPHIAYRNLLPPSPLPRASSSFSCSKLPLAPSSVCVLDPAFLDGSVRKCRETQRVLAGLSVFRCFSGVWQLFSCA